MTRPNGTSWHLWARPRNRRLVDSTGGGAGLPDDSVLLRSRWQLPRAASAATAG